jgi:hypothetical protein
MDVVRALLEAWFEKRHEQITPRLLVDGDDLMREFSLPPGPLIGELLEIIQEAQAVGTVTNSEQAYDLAREEIGKINSPQDAENEHRGV